MITPDEIEKELCRIHHLTMYEAIVEATQKGIEAVNDIPILACREDEIKLGIALQFALQVSQDSPATLRRKEKPSLFLRILGEWSRL